MRSTPARLAAVLAAVAVLAVAFLVLRPDDEQPASSGTPASTATPAPTPDQAVEQEATGGSPAQATATVTAAATATATAEPVPLLRPGREITVQAHKGDTVRLRVRVPAADELHIHGYDRTVALPPDRTVTVTLQATIEGRFEMELHGSDERIGILEVRP